MPNTAALRPHFIASNLSTLSLRPLRIFFPGEVGDVGDPGELAPRLGLAPLHHPSQLFSKKTCWCCDMLGDTQPGSLIRTCRTQSLAIGAATVRAVRASSFLGLFEPSIRKVRSAVHFKAGVTSAQRLTQRGQVVSEAPLLWAFGLRALQAMPCPFQETASPVPALSPLISSPLLLGLTVFFISIYGFSKVSFVSSSP